MRRHGVRATDIHVEAVEVSFEDHRYRTPIKFGGVALEQATLLNVECVVRTVAGRRARGFGSMPLGNVWSFPSKVLRYDQTLAAMKALAKKCQAITMNHNQAGHPIDLGIALEHEFLRAADEVGKELQLAQPIPKLCTLVVGSPFDAALHDAFGKVHGQSAYHTYGPDFLEHDLGRYLGPKFAGETLDRYLLRDPKPQMPLYHLVGALDAIDEPAQRINDGLPETLPEWIRADGLTHFKIKLNGDDLDWDLERIVHVDRTVAATQRERDATQWWYSLDFNERCANVGYLLELLHKLRDRAPAGFDRVQYIEQPTARDLRADRSNTMHEAARLKPIVIDESLTDLESLYLARDMGYTGAALKACKGQSQSLLLAAAAQKEGMFLCVQDLTCPGASLIHSAGLAAHVPGVAAIESNARQYCPAANAPWAERFPGIFRIRDGTMKTGCLTGPGLGAVPPE